MFGRKGLSYAKIIKSIILSSKGKKMTLQDIYARILNQYPEVCLKKGWRNSIRHNLSLKTALFYKIPRTGKGNYWAVKNDIPDFCADEIKVTQISSEGKEILFTGNLDSMDEDFECKFSNYEFKFNK